MAKLAYARLKELLHYNQIAGTFTWISKPDGKVNIGDLAGSISKSNGYIIIGIDGSTYLAHRLAFLWMNGVMPEFVDHGDHVRTNNVWDNLSAATRQENNKNIRLRRDNASGFVGVSWNKLTGKWRARVNVDGKNISLGCFALKETAIAARKAANIKYGFHQNHGMVGV